MDNDDLLERILHAMDMCPPRHWTRAQAARVLEAVVSATAENLIAEASK
ncbi:hypothetical protein [Mycolicibacterium goodii]|uniref:Transposase n=1 Tax=Mycolicibacterium goodii TaxID=134601 RepID=A0ABS6HNX5_MYCGD|nr:hypothetical protein [Mycolicibacterium goodii]MBU8824401.1 hypothetical protein [Mycolicibacterium goodii]MBU8838426.1 hypothetical protein [Mycolicibacterium goodii]